MDYEEFPYDVNMETADVNIVSQPAVPSDFIDESIRMITSRPVWYYILLRSFVYTRENMQKTEGMGRDDCMESEDVIKDFNQYITDNRDIYHLYFQERVGDRNYPHENKIKEICDVVWKGVFDTKGGMCEKYPYGKYIHSLYQRMIKMDISFTCPIFMSRYSMALGCMIALCPLNNVFKKDEDLYNKKNVEIAIKNLFI